MAPKFLKTIFIGFGFTILTLLEIRIFQLFLSNIPFYYYISNGVPLILNTIIAKLLVDNKAI